MEGYKVSGGLVGKRCRSGLMASLKGGLDSWTGRNWAVRKRGGAHVCTWDAWNSGPVGLSLIHSCKIRIKENIRPHQLTGVLHSNLCFFI